jgi:hypothetical protein
VIILNQSIPEELRGVCLRGKGAKSGGADSCSEFPIDHVVRASFGEFRPMRGKASALEALVEFLEKEKEYRFREVTR